VRRDVFYRAIRAAGTILGEEAVLVSGSQALHASVSSDRPPGAARYVKVVIAALDDPDDRKADLIDGATGEASMFTETSAATPKVSASPQPECRPEPSHG